MIVTGFVALFATAFATMAAVPALFVLGSPGSHDPARCSLRGPSGQLQILERPSRLHWFGTDQQGCDLFARTIYAARISIGIAIIAVVVATFVGCILGGVAGFVGGRVDAVLTRSVEVFSGLPPVVFAVLVLSSQRGERSLALVASVLGVLGFPTVAKVVRVAVMECRGRDFVEAAEAGGASRARILLRHIGPNVAPTVMALASLGVGPAIASETTLAFLGLSVAQPAAGWGVLVAEGRNHLADRPHLLLIPVTFLVLAAFSFVLLGDLFDGRSRRSLSHGPPVT